MFGSNSRRKAVSNRVQKNDKKHAVRRAAACTLEMIEPRIMLTGGTTTYVQQFEGVALGTHIQFQNIDNNMNAQPVPNTAGMYSDVEASPVDNATHGHVMHTHADDASDGRSYMPQIDIHGLGPAGPTGYTTETVNVEFDFMIPATTGAASYFADGFWFGVRNSGDFAMFGENIIKGNGLYVKAPKDTNNGRTGGNVFIGSGIDSWTGAWHHMKYTVGPIAGGNITFSIDMDNGAYTASAVVASEAGGNGTAESYWDQFVMEDHDTTGTHDVYFDNFSITAGGGGGNTGSIAGNVFNDSNSNGTKDGAETGINAWTVYLDTNNNNTLDAGETSTSTDASGNYTFGSLAAGTYHVKQQLQSGYRKTNPGSGIPGYDVAVAGAAVTGKNFGDTTNIYIGGTVFSDGNSNGVKDAGENGIAGVVINVVSNNSTVATRTTDAAGFWQVKGLSQGTGEVQIVTPANSTITAPAAGKHTGSMTSGQQNGQLNFGVHSNAAQTPTAPDTAAAAAVSASAINVSWHDKSGDETGFKIDYSTSNTFPAGSTTTVTSGANTTSLQVGGLTAGTQYFFRVRATNGSGDSGNSNTANATTQAAGPGYAFASSIAPDQAAADADIATSWTNYKSKYITATGAGGGGKLRVLWDDNTSTVSEGIGYAMIMAVYNNDQTTFNGLWNYAKAHMNVHGLMNWKIDSSGNTTGQNGATDGDEDMAFALVVADKKWTGYTTDATNLINTIFANEVEAGTSVLKPGDFFGGSSQTNPSYFAPAYYRIFAKYTNQSGWNAVADKCYTIIAAINTHNSGTGLVPDWCTSNGTASGGNSYNYTYDATRFATRIAEDYAWFGTAAAKSQLDLINAFFKNIGATNIKDGYSITGSVTGQYHNAAFVSGPAAAAIASSDSSYKTAIFNENKSLTAFGTYFNDSLRLISEIFTAGRMTPPAV